ncbi:hypothetical protein POUND7_012346 [Theobroma cacao]
MIKALGTVCKTKGKLTVKEIGESNFLFRFVEKDYYDRIKEGHLWCFDRNVMVLKDYDEEFMEPKDLDFGKEEFWPQTTGLPTRLMNKEVAKAIGNMVVRFIRVDGDEEDLRDRFMKIRVLLDLSKPLRRGIMLSMEDGKARWLAIQYERLPRFRYNCGVMGHNKDCTNTCLDDNGEEDKAKDGMADDRSRSNDGVGAQSRFTSRTLNEILSDNNMEDSASDCQNRSEERDEPDPGAIGNRTHEQEIRFPHHLCDCAPIEADDKARIQFAQNLEFLETEFFMNGTRGEGLGAYAPEFAKGGPPPIGAKKANLDPLLVESSRNLVIRKLVISGTSPSFQIIRCLLWQAIVTKVGGIPRPLLDTSSENFAKLFDKAVGYCLDPPFDPYANTNNFLLASYAIPYVGLEGYVGTIPFLHNYTSRKLVASLLGVESGQDAVLRALLYEKACEKVEPYDITVADFTNMISGLRNKLANCGIKDEGLIVPLELGAENRTTGNVLSADTNSLSYARTPPEILRMVYGDGDEHKPGAFFPEGANGNIPRAHL